MYFIAFIAIIIFIMVIYSLDYNNQEQIIYFPDGSHIKRDLIKNLNFYYLMNNPKRKIYFDDYLISVENNTLMVYEYIDGNYHLMTNIGKAMTIINGYLF